VNSKPEKFRSEDEWTAKLRDMLSRRSDVITGIGDDAAVVGTPGSDRNTVYTTDAVIESVHFLPATEPRRIGHKIVGRLLSDLAAMGAEPDHILLNLVVPPGTPAVIMDEIYQGAETLASRFGASIVGGDTATARPLAVHGFAAGHVPDGKAVLRSGARAGDRLFVTGTLGGSSFGKHLDFLPRVLEGVWLQSGGWATAMMDISDGLARDLRRLCLSSEVGAVVTASALPLSKEVDAAGSSDATSHALCDGEDYELLIAVSSDRAELLTRQWPGPIPLTCIGIMQGAPHEILIVYPDDHVEPMPHAGYDHLNKKSS